ncbi:hypothetical protein NADFUDRAFT_39445 [Nadsonia fulvescens var. elongata DSM 6958]|uniref:Hamartin-domain-containing protein n=1 Tax=Nadsonia fulvescens var. elongata DSM 6958 TaxID=857566 RepID=A0A1E3PRU0_9ASCO|nr:hypothetical protein NADFUDRAFT_39445 [Nadsonia fulvescens var. elongata DSM 6958]
MPGTLKNLSKVLETFFSQSSDSDVSKIYEAHAEFLERHKVIDPVESTRLHEELLDVYQKLVSGDKDKEVTFLKSITILAPCLVNTENLLIWFDLFFQPAINSAGYTNNVVAASREFLKAVMVRSLDEDNNINNNTGHINSNSNESGINVNSNNSGVNSNSNQFLNSSSINNFSFEVSKASSKGVLSALATLLLELFLSIKNITKEGQDATELEHQERRRFIRVNVKNLLVHFSKNHPILIFNTLNHYLVQKTYRIKSLVLLSAIISAEPRCVWKIVETPLLGNLCNCLLQDKSTAAISISITILIMIIPHVCNRLAKDNLLFDLFAIYSRLACWQEMMADERDEMLNNNDGQFSDHDDTIGHRDLNSKEGELDHTSLALLSSSLKTTMPVHGWDVLPVEKTVKGVDNSNLSALDYERLFTFLYALFPANFINFLRKPASYMKERNYFTPSMKSWDDYSINSSAKPLFEHHILNPYLLKFDLAQELTDTSRFVDMGETEKITVFCLSMHASFFHLPDPPQINLNAPFEDLPSLLESPIPKESLLYDDNTPGISRNNSLKNTAVSSSLKSNLTRHASDGARYGFGSPFTTAYYHRSSITQPSSPSIVSVAPPGLSSLQTPTGLFSQNIISPIHQDADSLLDAHQRQYWRRDGTQNTSTNESFVSSLSPVVCGSKLSVSEGITLDDNSQGHFNFAALSLASSPPFFSSFSSSSSQDRPVTVPGSVASIYNNGTNSGQDDLLSAPVTEFPTSISQVLEATQAVSAITVTSPRARPIEGSQLSASPPWAPMASSSANSSSFLSNSTATLTPLLTNQPDITATSRVLPTNVDDSFISANNDDTSDSNNNEKSGFTSNSSGSLKASLSFFEREYYLLKNELDFVVYIDHHNQVRLKMLKEELMTSVRHFDDVQHLVTTNKNLRGRILRLEEQLTKFREETMKYKNQRLQYETQLTQRNRDLKTQGDKFQLNLAEMEVEMGKLKENNKLLYNSVLEKEVKISRLELKVGSLMNEANQFEQYKAALFAGKATSNHFESRESAKLSQDEVNALYVRLEKLRIDKEVIEHEKAVLDRRYSIELTDLKNEITALKYRANNTPASVRTIVEDIRQASEERYAQISSAYKEISDRYRDLDKQFRAYALKSEVKLMTMESGQSSPTSSSDSSPGHKSLLGYQSHPGPSNLGGKVPFPLHQRSSLPLAASRNKSSSSSENGGPDRHHSYGEESHSPIAGINQYQESNTKEPPAPRKGEVRFKGRGGFQNATSNSKSKGSTPSTSAKLGTFRGFM